MSDRILLSFLGGGRQLDRSTGRGREYQVTRYRFEGAPPSEPTPFFGLALVEHARSTQRPFERILLAGTPHSMWDLFAQKAHEDGQPVDHIAMELIDRCSPRPDGQAPGAEPIHLEALSGALAGWHGIGHWNCLNISAAGEFGQQMELLSTLADAVPQDSELWIDVTHGFRIFPMLALALAQMLRGTRGVKVSRILYGAFDGSVAGETPVVELGGLLRVQEWTEAVAVWRATGSLAGFTPLLKTEGVNLDNQAGHIKDLSELEGYLNLPRARELRNHVRNGLNRDSPSKGTLSALFGPSLCKALAIWPDRLSATQRQLAREHLHRGDLLRAVILAHEGLVSCVVERTGKDAWDADFEAREKATKSDAADSDPKQKKLRALRNSLVHGTAADWRDTEELRRNPDKLRGFLKTVLECEDLWR